MSTGRHHIKPGMPPRDYKIASLAGFRAILALSRSRGSGSNWLLPTQATSAPATIKSPKVEDPAADYLWPVPQSSGASGPAASSVEPVRMPSWPVSLVQRPLIACRAVRDLPQLGSIPARIARSGFRASATGRHVCNTRSRLDAQPALANFPAMIQPRRAIPVPAHPSTLMAVQAVSGATYRR
jgi:hypothetical protein